MLNSNDILHTFTVLYEKQVLLIYGKMPRKVLCSVQIFVTTQIIVCKESIVLYLMEK